MTHHTNPATTPADISPSSPETAVYGDRGGIEGGSVMQVHPHKTGKFFVCDTLTPVETKYCKDFNVLELRKHNLRSDLMDSVRDVFADGRQYAFQLGEFLVKPYDFVDGRGMYIEWTATVLLVHASDAEIAECCIDSEPMIPEAMKRFNLLLNDESRRFERLEDGSGWRRIA